MRSVLLSGGCCLMLVAGLATAADMPKPPEKPAEIRVSVNPSRVRPGGDLEVRVQLEPIDGIKINRYPKIKLSVPEQDGVRAAAEGSTGNDGPPPPGTDPESNYYKTVDPVRLDLKLDESIAEGSHQLEGRLVYAYCVAASGFCARKKVPVKIPVAVDPS